MALSDQERQLFDQLERELRENDPAFASSLRTEPVVQQGASSWSVRQIVLGVVAVLVGLGVILLGVSLKLIVVGVLGFLIAAGGVYWASVSRQPAPALSDRSPGARASRSSKAKTEGFLKNLEDRWDERRGSL